MGRSLASLPIYHLLSPQTASVSPSCMGCCCLGVAEDKSKFRGESRLRRVFSLRRSCSRESCPTLNAAPGLRQKFAARQMCARLSIFSCIDVASFRPVSTSAAGFADAAPTTRCHASVAGPAAGSSRKHDRQLSVSVSAADDLVPSTGLEPLPPLLRRA